MTFFWGFLLSAFVGASCPDLSTNIQETVRKNTFKVVPRNFYASTMSVDAARDLYSSQCNTSHLTISDKMNCDVLKSCTGEDCKIEFMPFGSAFFVNEKATLVTAWHVVFPTHATPLYFMQNALSKISTEELNSKLSVLQPDFLLLNSEDEIIFDTKKQTAHYQFWGNPLSTIYQALGKNRQHPYGYFENAPDDFVAIKLSDFVPAAKLSLASKKTKSDLMNKCLYAGGYQYHDGKFRFSAGSKKSVKEMQSQLSTITPFQINPLPMSQEELLKKSLPEILSIMGYSEDNIQETLKKYDEALIWSSIHVVLDSQVRHLRDQSLEARSDLVFYNAPALPGQSGGPIVDENGYLVGLTTNGFFDSQVMVDGHFASYGAVGLLLTALETYW
ncbi:serine protease [bacterium]|nr:serine protease [bacterium]